VGPDPLRRGAGSGCIRVPDFVRHDKNEDTWQSLMQEEERELFDFSDPVKREFCEVVSA
jgi:hypothetical protein